MIFKGYFRLIWITAYISQAVFQISTITMNQASTFANKKPTIKATTAAMMTLV